MMAPIPVANVSANIEAMVEGALEPDNARLESCYNELMRITDIISDLEKLRQIENEKLVLERTSVDVKELCESVIQAFKAQLESKQISCTVKANATAPAINVLETEKEYKVELAAPGMTKDDFNVRIDEDNNLVISMEKKTENKEEKKDGRYLRREFSYSKFQQTMILPDNVDKEKIAASVEHGVLNIELPKLSEEEVKKPNRQIEIK